MLDKIFSIKNENSKNYKHKVINIFGIKFKFKTSLINKSELKINKNDRCLIIAPHPDDESIGAGGLLLKYPKNFDVIVLSDGRYGGILEDGSTSPEKIVNQRIIELKNAMEYIGISNYRNLMIEDRSVKKNLNLLNNIDLKPYNYVFVPNKYEKHIDHCCVLNKVKQLLRWSPNVKLIVYEVWTPLVNPELFIDINDVIDKKTELLKLYTSQVRAIDYVSRALSLNCYRGTMESKSFSECFMKEKTMLQHFFSK